MRVQTLGRKRVQVTTPNGTKLFYLDDQLLAVIKGGDLYFNFTVQSGRDAATKRAVTTWARGVGADIFGGGERDEAELIKMAMRPVEINYGDFTPNQQSKV